MGSNLEKQIKPLLDTSLPVKAVVLGSGLAEIAESFKVRKRVAYKKLAGFPQPRVGGHGGELLLCSTASCNLLVLSGRAHYYERGDIKAMQPVIAALQALGCEQLLLTNAAGSLRPDLEPGELMLISDHINWAGLSPLNNIDSDQRFVDLGAAYDPHERQRLEQIADELEIKLIAGVYAFFPGPQFETPAEIRAVGILGADAVGMSTVPEVILARYYQMRVNAISVITNMAAGLSSERLSQQHTMAMAQRAKQSLGALLRWYLG